jgi:hypothetical protein
VCGFLWGIYIVMDLCVYRILGCLDLVCGGWRIGGGGGLIYKSVGTSWRVGGCFFFFCNTILWLQ